MLICSMQYGEDGLGSDMLALMSLPSLDTLTDPGNPQGRHYSNICPPLSLSLSFPERIFDERSIKYVCLPLSFLDRDRGVGVSAQGVTVTI